MAAPLTGVVPVVPTIFHDDETVDLDGTARVVDYLIDAGVDGLCLLANYSEQFSLTDAERDAIARTLLEHVAGRLPVIVTTSHYSARVAAARSRAAQDMGAAMVMVMPPFFGATLTVPGPAVIEYFKQVADAIDIPVMVQDAPLSPTPLPVSLLIDLVRQVPQVQYAKIEVPQAADKLHALVSALGDSLPGPFDGEESVTLIPDLDAGATGTMPSSMVPAELGQIVRRYLAGDRARRRERLGRPAAAHPFREPPVRTARAEDPAGRGRHHRLGPDARAVRAGIAKDPPGPDRTGRSTRPADHALGPVTSTVMPMAEADGVAGSQALRAGPGPPDGLCGVRRRAAYRAVARQPHLVVPVAIGAACPGRPGPVHRPGPDRHGRLGQARRRRPGTLYLRLSPRVRRRLAGGARRGPRRRPGRP